MNFNFPLLGTVRMLLFPFSFTAVIRFAYFSKRLLVTHVGDDHSTPLRRFLGFILGPLT